MHSQFLKPSSNMIGNILHHPGCLQLQQTRPFVHYQFDKFIVQSFFGLFIPIHFNNRIGEYTCSAQLPSLFNSDQFFFKLLFNFVDFLLLISSPPGLNNTCCPVAYFVKVVNFICKTKVVKYLNTNLYRIISFAFFTILYFILFIV